MRGHVIQDTKASGAKDDYLIPIQTQIALCVAGVDHNCQSPKTNNCQQSSAITWWLGSDVIMSSLPRRWGGGDHLLHAPGACSLLLRFWSVIQCRLKQDIIMIRSVETHCPMYSSSEGKLTTAEIKNNTYFRNTKEKQFTNWPDNAAEHRVRTIYLFSRTDKDMPRSMMRRPVCVGVMVLKDDDEAEGQRHRRRR